MKRINVLTILTYDLDKFNKRFGKNFNGYFSKP